MKVVNYKNHEIQIFSHNTIVIGTGCAGYNSADCLYDLGVDCAVVTEGVNMGTSRNTGSDKQTYYKLSLCSDSRDSIYDLAENLFNGGSVHGDIALAEAAGSVRAFMKLVQLGVPFPTNKYGEYVGYKTDHDPKKRATSCGPLTSKIMTEKLEQSVIKKNIPIYNNMQVIEILTDENNVCGLVALNSSCKLSLFLCKNIIMATGGPAIAYKQSVYPQSQTGMTGTAIMAGVKACNLQEWQYGIASKKFRWNVSGTYQQVLPRYVSMDKDGNISEFLPKYFENPTKALDLVFLKGYQWPFDSDKITASSLIDIIIHNEISHKGNRVFMDFTTDPIGLDFDTLNQETLGYLSRSNALIKTPIARLKKMNPKAIELYKNNGIDITKELLEVAVCAQHCNGGLAVDFNWQTNINGLYAAGEVAGTFGISRPGGSALNSTQVGSLRASADIAKHGQGKVEFSEKVLNKLDSVMFKIEKWTSLGDKNLLETLEFAQSQMSLCSAHIRKISDMKSLKQSIDSLITDFEKHDIDEKSLNLAFKIYDMLIVQKAMLSAMILTAENCGSRGSALVLDENGTMLTNELSNYTYIKSKSQRKDKIVETDNFVSTFSDVRKLEKTDDWFEKVFVKY